VIAFDPAGMEQARGCLPPRMTYAADCASALCGADGAVVVTEWNEFRGLSATWLSRVMRGRVVVDLRNLFDPVEMAQAGLTYVGIGRRARAKARRTAEAAAENAARETPAAANLAA
jgi:UDPglucose 6-dehydrogenase